MSEQPRPVGEKRAQRSVRWEVNMPLLKRSLIAATVLLLLAGGLYALQSRQLASSMLAKADQAGAQSQWEQQITWLTRYRLLAPDDLDAQVQLALASDAAVDLPPANRLDRVDRARIHLRDALAALAQADATSPHQDDLRRRLIARLLQFGVRYADEAERQILQLNADPGDAAMLRAMALALLGQVALENEGQRDPAKYQRDQQYWIWLAQQPLGHVVETAWRSNPDDLTLAGNLIDLALNDPDRFAGDADATAAVDPEKLAAEVAASLATMPTVGRAQWILYRYGQATADPQAAERLATVAPQALNRLTQHAGEVRAADQAAADDTAATKKESNAAANAIPTLPPVIADDSYSAQWDYELVLLSAIALLGDNQATDQQDTGDQQTARERLDQLIALPNLDVPASAIQSVYLTRGQLEWQSRDHDQAWQLWQQGIDRLGDDSLQLQLANAASLADQGPVPQADAAVAKLSQLVRRRSLDLAGPAGANLSRGGRLQMQKDLDAATWTAQSLAGQISLRQGNLTTAITLLQNSLDSQFPVEDSQRVSSAALLASAYERAGTWDLAATTYERAVNLAPQENQYRVLAAQAWANAGDNDRAFRQWQAVDGNSLPLAVARARAMVNEQLARPPASRDFTDAARAIASLRNQIQKIPAGDDDADADRQRGNLQAQVELLALAIPDADDGKTRDGSVQRLVALAARYPDSGELQSVAALTLTAVGKTDAARDSLDQLRQATGDDSLLYQTTFARIAAIQGKAAAGIDALAKHAAAHPEDAADALTLAADLAQADGDANRAYELLASTPDAVRTPELLFRVFTLSLALDASADAGRAMPTTTPADWERGLRDLEGASGTWWRLARATRLLNQLQQLGTNDAARGPLLKEIESLQTQIRAARPRWGLTHSLEGQIAAVRGESQRAIDALRRGIAGGDRRITTLLALVAQLTQANRVAEAEAEFSRFERLADSNSTINSLAVAIAEKKGDFTQGVDLARAGTKANPRDTTAWLLLGQAAMVAARSTDQPDARQTLVAEAKRALDQALIESNNASLPAYQLRVRFQAAFFDTDQVRGELQRALESNLPEPTRSLFVGLTYVELQDAQAALPVLTRAIRIVPDNPDVYVAMSEYHRLQRDDAQFIAMLEKAYELAPSRIDVRSKLALAIALRDGAEVPWQRLDQLLDSDLEQSSTNRLLHALILINRGDEQRQQQAVDILRELIRRADANSDDAIRMLAALERRRWSVASADPNSDESKRALAEARRLYTLLTRRPDPAAMDLYRFADLMLRADQTAEVGPLADQLDRMTEGSPIALDLRLRLARQTGQEEKAAELVQEWTDKAIQSGAVLQASAWETAGRALSNLGFHDQALDWLEQAYKENPENFRGFVVGLARARKFDRALQICQSHYSQTQSPDAVALMADVVSLSGATTDVPPQAEATFAEALQRFPNEPAVYESIATLRLAQHRYTDAVALYERAEQLAPKNVRVLNNLAMALSEVPGRVADALPRIQKAIDLYGRSPELLDTQGLVLLRNDRYDDAVKTLREATAGSDDPRYRFHLLMALMRSGDKKESLAQWAQLDVKSLKQTVLTPAERRDLDSMQQEFARRQSS